MRFWTKGLFAIVLSCSISIPAAAEEAGSFRITSDVIFGHKSGMALTMDVVQPEKPNGAAVLFMVSGGWNSMWVPPEETLRAKGDEPNIFADLVHSGYTLFIVRHGSAPHFKVPEAVADVRRAVRFVRLNAEKYGVDADRLGVWGGSAGGHLSLMLGTTADDGNPDSKDPVERESNRVQAVVAYFPPTQIEEFFPLKDRLPALEFDPALASQLSPLQHVSGDDAPTLLIHGDKDELVPLNQSERILDEFRKANVSCELIVIEGAAHGFAGEDRQRAEQALKDWFERQLLKTDAP